MTFLKSLATAVLATYCTIASTISGQTKTPVTGRVLIDGIAAGKGETVILYNKKGNDTLKTAFDGYINGTTTDIPKTKQTEVEQTVWITQPEGAVKNIGEIVDARIYSAATKEEISDITKELNKTGTIPKNMASAVYLLKVTEKESTYLLKYVLIEGNIIGTSQHKKTIKQQTETPQPLYKTLDITVIDSIKVLESDNIVEKTFPGTTSTGTINLGDLNVQGKVTINLTAYGVEKDSGKVATKLENYIAWVGRRDKNSSQNKFATNGIVRIPKGTSKDTLFIEHEGYHQRNLLIRNDINQNITEYLITDKIDIDFFETVFLRNSNYYPLAMPDKKFGRDLPIWIGQAPDAIWADYAKDAVEKEIARYTGGIFTGHVNSDSNNVYTKKKWDNIPTIGMIITNTNPIDNILSSQIYYKNVSNPTNEQWKEDTHNATKKETTNAIFDQVDIFTTNVPISWKQSKWYNASDSYLYRKTEWTDWDLNCGRVAAKLTLERIEGRLNNGLSGYLINVIHNPKPQ